MAEDIQVKREITVEVDAETAERMKKKDTHEVSRFIAMKGNEPEEITPHRIRLHIWPVFGLLTSHTNFPVRGNDGDEDQQSAGVRFQQVQI